MVAERIAGVSSASRPDRNADTRNRDWRPATNLLRPRLRCCARDEGADVDDGDTMARADQCHSPVLVRRSDDGGRRWPAADRRPGVDVVVRANGERGVGAGVAGVRR